MDTSTVSAAVSALTANSVLVLVVAILIIFAIAGYQKGLIKMVVSIASVIITFILVLIFQPQVSNMLRETAVYSNLYENVHTMVNDRVKEEFHGEELAGKIENASEKAEAIIAGFNLPEKLSEKILEKLEVEDDAGENLNNLVIKISTELVNTVIDMIVFLISFVLILSAITFVFKVLNLISYLPILHGLNRMAGLVVGLLEGVCIVWVLIILVTVFGSAELNSGFFQDVQNNAFLTFLYDNNIIMNFLLK